MFLQVARLSILLAEQEKNFSHLALLAMQNDRRTWQNIASEAALSCVSPVLHIVSLDGERFLRGESRSFLDFTLMRLSHPNLRSSLAQFTRICAKGVDTSAGTPHIVRREPKSLRL